MNFWDTEFLLYVDRPEKGELSEPIFQLEGWYALPRPYPTVGLTLAEIAIGFQAVDRPDVRKTFPGKVCQGFRAMIDAGRFCAPAGPRDPLELALVIEGQPVTRLQLTMKPGVEEQAVAGGQARRRKQQWLESHTTCPLCPPGQGRLEFATAVVRCLACGASFPQGSGALDLLPPPLRDQFHIDPTDNVSSNSYDEAALALVDEVRQAGGKVLDCGSGLRPRIDETVICSEVVDYPTVDVLAANQCLPFPDEVFDAALSLAVLEHVSDPFRSASELVRVLKPGGKLYCCVPFLQPEHGYPHHYYNMTRSGLAQLFEGQLDIEDHFVPHSGEPIWTLHWFLSWYARELPEPARSRFQKMKVGDLLSAPVESWLEDPLATNLSSDGRWQLASVTAAILRKPSRQR